MVVTQVYTYIKIHLIAHFRCVCSRYFSVYILYLNKKVKKKEGRKEGRKGGREGGRKAKRRKKDEHNDLCQAWLPGQRGEAHAQTFLQMAGRGSPRCSLGNRNRMKGLVSVKAFFLCFLTPGLTPGRQKVGFGSHTHWLCDLGHVACLLWALGSSPGK